MRGSCLAAGFRPIHRPMSIWLLHFQPSASGGNRPAGEGRGWLPDCHQLYGGLAVIHQGKGVSHGFGGGHRPYAPAMEKVEANRRVEERAQSPVKRDLAYLNHRSASGSGLCLSSSLPPWPLFPSGNLGCGAELIHTAALLHDDVVDEANTAAAAPTVNHLWGDKAAVLWAIISC